MSKNPETLFVHITGASQSPKSMQWIMASLAELDYPSIAPKLPTDETGKSLSDVAEVLADAVEAAALPNQPVALVGYSYGGNHLIRGGSALQQRGSRLIRQGRLRGVFVGAGIDPSTIKESLGRPFDDEDHPDKNTAAHGDISEPVTNQIPGYSFTPDDMMKIFTRKGSREYIFPDAPPERQAEVIAMQQPQYRPEEHPVLQTFPNMPVDSIVCQRDGTVKKNYQVYMALRVLGIVPYFIDSDHSPHVSRDEELAQLLARIVETPPQVIPTKKWSSSAPIYWKAGETMTFDNSLPASDKTSALRIPPHAVTVDLEMGTPRLLNGSTTLQLPPLS